MTFFYDLNKRLAALADKQDLHESKVAESEKWIQKAVNPANKGNLHKALHVAQDKTIPKAKIDKATHSKNPKLRHMAQFAKNVANEGHCPACDCSPCKCNKMDEEMADEGTGVMHFKDQLAKAKGEKTFKLGDKEFPVKEEKKKSKPDYIDLDGDGNKKETMKKAASDKKRSTGTAFDKEHMDKVRKEKEAETHSRYDVHDTGYSKRYTRKAVDTDVDADDEVSTEPKRKGRPKGPTKGPERTTKGAWKHKGERKVKAKEDIDSDGVLMTRATNCSSESIDSAKQGEYNDEAGMTKDSLHTIVRHARELESALRSNENMPEWVQEKIGQIKGMMSSVTDYILSTHERDVEQHSGKEGLTTVIPEKAVSKAQRKFMGMAHAIQKGEKIKGASPELKKVAKTMKPTDTHDFAATKEKGLPKKVKKADEDKGDGNLANNAKPYDKVTQGDVVAGRLGKDEMGGKKKKEEKVDETTVSGSVATATTSGKSSSGGMQFGKGVYESFNSSVEKMITEGMNVSVNMNAGEDGQTHKSITVSAEGEEADVLAQLLKAAGIEHQGSESCSTCGATPCGCEQQVDENSPDWPTDTAVSYTHLTLPTIYSV